MDNESPNPPESQQNKPLTPPLRILVFNIGTIYLAFPVKVVKRIVSQFELAETELNSIDIARVDTNYIIVIDLYQKLFKSKAKIESEAKKYLLIAKNSLDEEFAIIIEENPPILQEIALDRVRSLPESYLNNKQLNIASHVTIIPREKSSLTVLILDPDRILPARSQQ